MELLKTLSFTIITVSVPIITGYICAWIKSLYDKNKIRIKNEYIDQALSRIVNMIIATVETTTSTYVKQLKKDNIFDLEAQKQAFKMTYDNVKKQLTEEYTQVIIDVYGDVETYLLTTIEDIVEKSKT